MAGSPYANAIEIGSELIPSSTIETTASETETMQEGRPKRGRSSSQGRVRMQRPRRS